VTLAGDAGEVELATGLVFGTAIRDVTGTVDPASRTDSRDLAAAAAAINRLAQERAIAPLKAAAAGRTVEFVACGQVQGTLPGDKPWRLIPVRITLHEAPSGSAGAPR
jgi:predicted lipoprotein